MNRSISTNICRSLVLVGLVESSPLTHHHPLNYKNFPMANTNWSPHQHSKPQNRYSNWTKRSIGKVWAIRKWSVLWHWMATNWRRHCMDNHRPPLFVNSVTTKWSQQWKSIILHAFVNIALKIDSIVIQSIEKCFQLNKHRDGKTNFDFFSFASFQSYFFFIEFIHAINHRSFVLICLTWHKIFILRFSRFGMCHPQTTAITIFIDFWCFVVTILKRNNGISISDSDFVALKIRQI